MLETCIVYDGERFTIGEGWFMTCREEAGILVQNCSEGWGLNRARY
jgi:hypothetical protein